MAVGLILAGLEILDSSFESRKPEFLNTLELNWTIAKQSLRRKIYEDEILPSTEIQILELTYDHRFDFWVDVESKKKLVAALKSYPGPFVTNLGPTQMLKDSILHEIFKMPNYIRSIALYPGAPSNNLVEERLSSRFHYEVSNKEGRWVRIEPNSEKLFEGEVFWGVGELKVNNSYSAIVQYPLHFRSSSRHIPSLGLALFQKLVCDRFILKPDGNLICQSQPELHLPSEIPIFYYDKKFATMTKIEDLKPSTKVLIVDVVDPTTIFRTSYKSMSGGSIVATALSNLLNSHFAKRSNALAIGEFVSFMIASMILLVLGLWGSLRSCLAFLFVAFFVWILGDLAGGVFMNLNSRPLEEWVSLALLGTAVIFGRSRVEAERTKLIERAFSGYVSPKLLKRILSGQQDFDLRGRRKYLTTFLVDIARFSKLVAEVQPEVAFKALQKVFQVIDPIIFEYGGMIDKKTGDGVFAFFGDELDLNSGEVHKVEVARRAVSAGLKIQSAMKELKASELGLHEVPKLRIGINTGMMLIGNTGSNIHFNYTVLGEAVNFTQRLEAACSPGEVLIGTETATLVQNTFELVPIEIDVKYESKKLTAFKVISAKKGAA